MKHLIRSLTLMSTAWVALACHSASPLDEASFDQPPPNGRQAESDPLGPVTYAGQMHLTSLSRSADGKLVLEVTQNAEPIAGELVIAAAVTTKDSVREVVQSVGSLSASNKEQVTLNLNDLGLEDDQNVHLELTARLFSEDGESANSNNSVILETHTADGRFTYTDGAIPFVSSTVNDLNAAQSSQEGDVGQKGQALTSTQAEICFDQQTLFVDGGAGEDYWTSTSATYRRHIGTRVKYTLTTTGATPSYSYLGDGDGTNALGCVVINVGTTAKEYRFTLYTRGVVHSNAVKVEDNGYGDVHSRAVTFTVAPGKSYVQRLARLTGSSDTDANGRRNAQWNVYMAASYSIYRKWSQTSGQDYNLESYILDSGGSRFLSASNVINIGHNTTSTHYNRKFVIAHEVGHAVMFKASGKSAPGCSSDANDSSCPEIARDGTSSTDHSLTSSEQHGCAAGEGYAHFYAAAVFNNGSDKDQFNNTDCGFRYYKVARPNTTDWRVAIDCEFSTTNFPDSYYANVCDTSKSGRSTELDWMKTYWDFVTDNSAVEFSHVTDIVRSSASYTSDPTKAYANIDAAAKARGGNIWSSWQSARNRNILNK